MERQMTLAEINDELGAARTNKKEFLDCIERATILIRENDKKPLILNVGDNTME